MGDIIRVHVEGLAQLETALRELPDATAKNVLRRLGRQRLQPLADAMREHAPIDEGDLRESIAVSTKLSRSQRGKHVKDGKDDVEIFAGPGPHPQAHLQEFGTNHHPPQPFVRPAWDSGKDALLEGIKEDLWMEIKKAAERLARKAAKAGR